MQIRDTLNRPFVTTAARNLTIQGNQGIDLFALTHPQTQIQSGGNLRLISDGTISADAHLTTGGNLRLQTLTGAPGNFVSLFDPIIYANGDVLFGDYTGAALKVEATGSIEGGNIRITSPDVGVPITDPDFAILSTEPTVILRAGVAAVPAPNLPQLGVGDIPTDFNSGTVQPGNLPGSIRVGSIDTSSDTGGDGGSIILAAAGNITGNGDVSSYSFSDIGDSGNGGTITFAAANGSLLIQGNFDASSFSDVGGSGNGGEITLTAAKGAIFGQSFAADSLSSLGDSGNGGSISLIAGEGDLSVPGGLFAGAAAIEGNSGNGGAIFLTATNGNLSVQSSLDSASASVSGSSGSGGAISVTAANGNLTIDSASSYSRASFGPSGSGGTIFLTATNGDLSVLFGLNSFSYTETGESGDGGVITVTAAGNLTNGVNRLRSDWNSFSYSENGNSGNGGAISAIAAKGNLTTRGSLSSSSVSAFGNSGNGGAVVLSAPQGNITGREASSLNTFSVAPQGNASSGGAVTLAAQQQLSRLEVLTTSSSAQAGPVSIIGQGDLSVTNTVILTSKQVALTGPFFDPITVAVDGTGRSGDVAVTSTGRLTLSNSRIESDTKGSDAAGNVRLASPSWIHLSNTQITSSTSDRGQAGTILVKADQGLTLDNASRLSAITTNVGNAGDIRLISPTVTVSDSLIDSSTASAGSAGAVVVNAGAIALNQSTIRSQSTGSGNSGILTLVTGRLDLANNALLSTSTSNTGNAGNLIIQASDGVTLQTGSQINSRSIGTGNGGTVDIRARSLFLNQNSQINASTVSSDGGNLRLTLAETLRLRDRSLLNAEAGGNGNGGNIILNAPFIIGLANSDIIANAFQGRGGTIKISTNGIFGLKFGDQLTPDNDITASSQFGINGTVQINLLRVNPTNGLDQLAIDLVDASQQLAQGCAANQGSSFVITGRGGLPPTPMTQTRSDRPWTDTRNLTPYRNRQVTDIPQPTIPAPLVEATGWRRNAKGDVEVYATTGIPPASMAVTCALWTP